MEYNKRQKTTNRVREIVFMGILIALDVVAVRFLSFQTPAMRIGFGFVANLIAGMYLGPLRAGIVGVTADLLGFFLFGQGLFFPGFTISAGVQGLLAGFFLEGKKSKDLPRIIIYAILSTVLVDTLMNTTWLVLMLDNGNFAAFWPRLSLRVPNQIAVTVLKVILVPILYRAVFQRFKATGVEHAGIREPKAIN